MKHAYSEQTILSEIFELMNSWISDSRRSDTPIVEHRSPKELKQALSLTLSPEGDGMEGVMQDLRNYLKFAVRTGHPGYVNQLFGGFNFPAFAGELITALTNTSMYTYEVAPVATLMEIELISKMLSYTGWENGNGGFMTGGSNTNLVAMLLARNSVFKGVKHTGINAHPRMVIFASERSHFSLLKAANTTGIGQEGVIKVPLDSRGRMRGDAFATAVETAMASGYSPFMVTSTAGTTETGSFDAIDEIDAVAKQYGLWHHVDGSWGGSLLLSDKYRDLFSGLEKADSFSWNPHKMMNIPLICSVLLVKDPNIMREEIQSYDADYIYHENENSAYDLGPASLQCGRRVDSLKLWTAWKYFGDVGYAKRVEWLMHLADYCTEIIDAADDLELMFTTESVNVNFRYKAPKHIDIDSFNEKLRYALVRKGEIMVNYCRLDSGLSIRLVLLNADLTEADMDRFFQSIRSAAAGMLAEAVKAD